MRASDRAIPSGTKNLADLADAAPWPGEVLGENLRAIRAEKRLTQREAARLFASRGLGWSAATLATVETRARTLHREVTVSELTILARCLEIPLARLFDGAGLVRVAEGAVTTRAEIRALLSGEKPEGGALLITGTAVAERAIREWLRPPEDPDVITETEHIAADELGHSVDEIFELAQQLWGHGLTKERDHRIGKDLNRLPKESLRARRGQVTRELIDEMRAEFAKRAGSKKRGRR